MSRLDIQLILNPILTHGRKGKEKDCLLFPQWRFFCLNELEINAKIFLSFYFLGHLSSLNQDFK